MTDSAGSPLASRGVTVFDVNDDLASTFTAADGTYQLALSNLPTTPTVVFVQFAGSNGYLNQFYDGHRTRSEADTLIIAPGIARTGIDAVLIKPESAYISGRVSNMDDNPVSGFQVSAGNWSGTVQQGTDWTADDGTYRIELADLAQSFDDIWVDAIDGNNPVVYITDRIEDLKVAPGSELTGIDLRLRKVGFAYISGRVTDEAGNPVGDMQVAVGDRSKSTVFNNIKTTPDGSYQLSVSPSWLPSPNIFVQFNAPEGYERQFYNGRSLYEDADLVWVEYGSVITGIDAVLQRSTETSISGKVTDEFANPVGDVRVTVSDVDGTIDTQSATTSANGTYQISLTGLVDDQNDIRVAFDWFDGYPTQWYNQKYVVAGADLLTAGPGSVLTGIDAKLARTAYIGGKVTDTAGNPLADAAVIVSSRDQSYKLPTVYTPPNGTYQIAVKDLDAIRDDIVVRFYGAHGYSQVFYPSKQDIVDAEALTIGPGYHLDHIDAVLSPPPTLSDCVLLSKLADQYEKMGNQDGDTDWRIRFDGDQAILTSVEAAQTGWQVGEVFWKSIHPGTVSGTCDMELLDVAGRSYPARIELDGIYLKSSEVVAGQVSNTEIWQPANTPAVVSGTVTDANGGPMANVTVTAVAITGPLGPETVTGENGSYTLQVNPLDLPDVGAAFRFSAAGFIDRFYPSAGRIADAKMIKLHPGDRADYVDVWLEADTGGVAGVNAPDLGGHGVLVENRGPVLDSGGDASAGSPPGGDPGDVVDGPTADGPPGGDTGDVVDGPTADGPPGGDTGDVVDGPTADGPPGGD
ncbi:MAG: hypothetical protein WBW88_07555, partial [Rhodothermales bacterium]